jgi:para-aminobenzoate synthetase component I
MIFSRFKWSQSSVLELRNPKSAYIYYRTTRFNLLTGFPETYSLDLFLKKLDTLKIQDKVDRPIVFHFYYELGLILQGLGHSVDDNTPLAVELEFESKKIISSPKSKISSLKLKSIERPTWSEYKKSFQHIQEELLEGNCYQVNLTFPFDFETEDLIDPRDLADFFFSRNYLSAYAHCTYLGEEMILSNSPECLFQYQNNKMYTMPIKGTVKVGSDWREQWKKLGKNLKEEGELNMITDLLKNDLNRLEYPRAKIVKARAPILVPGLLHQCSLLSVDLEKPLSLLKSLECLFPGGSVTGAPKKRVMQIIQQIERFQRGIYCGSTLLCFENKKVASINIRTASVNLNDKLWRYGAGGGVTLLSKPVNEFQEMESKVSSFLTSLHVPGYPPV